MLSFTRAVTMVLAAAVLALATADTGRPGPRQNGEVAAAVQRLADIEQRVAAVAETAELDQVMALFKLRSKHGFGIGKPGLVRPNEDGIEAAVMLLARRELSALEWRVRAEALAEAGYRTAAIAAVARAKPPGDLEPADVVRWKRWSGAMRQAALDLAREAKAQNAAGLKRAAIDLESACIRCHSAFRGRGAPVVAVPPPPTPEERLRRLLADARDPVGALAGALKDPDAAYRREAAERLARRGAGGAAVPALTAALRDADAEVRLAAAHALGRIGPAAAAAVPALAAALKDKDELVRMRAGVALGKVGPAAVPALRQALQDRDLEVRRLAAGALGRIGPPAGAAVPDLEAARRHPDEYLRTAAAEAIAQIKGR